MSTDLAREAGKTTRAGQQRTDWRKVRAHWDKIKWPKKDKKK